MKLVHFNFSTFLVMAFYLFKVNILFFCTIFLTLGSRFSMWIAILGSSLDISIRDQVNSDLFFLSSLVILITSSSINSTPTIVVFSGPSSSALTSSPLGWILLYLCLSYSSGASSIITSSCFIVVLLTNMHSLFASI